MPIASDAASRYRFYLLQPSPRFLCLSNIYNFVS